MDEAAVTRIMESLDTLAVKLGTTAEYLWSVLVKQAAVQGLMTLAGMAISIITAAVVYRIVVGIGTGMCKKEYDKKSVKIVMRLIVTLWICVTLVQCIGNAMKAFLSPEFWALEKIAEMF